MQRKLEQAESDKRRLWYALQDLYDYAAQLELLMASSDEEQIPSEERPVMRHTRHVLREIEP